MGRISWAWRSKEFKPYIWHLYLKDLHQKKEPSIHLALKITPGAFKVIRA